MKRGISSLMFTMFTWSVVEAPSPWLSLTPTARWKLSGKPPQVRDSGFADTTSKWSGKKWGRVGGEREGSALFWPPSFRQACRVRTAMSALPSSSLQTHPSTFLSPYSCYSWPSSPPWLLTSAMLYTMSLCPSSQYPSERVLHPCEETKAARDQGTSLVR